jgi:hypothetical protein
LYFIEFLPAVRRQFIKKDIGRYSLKCSVESNHKNEKCQFE